MIRVVLVDDHVVVRSGFAQLLSLEDDLEVIGQYSSAAQAWSALICDDVNVAVIDIAMPDETASVWLSACVHKTAIPRHYS